MSRRDRQSQSGQSATYAFGESQGRKTFVVPATAGPHVAVDSRLRGNDGRFSWLFAGRTPMETDLQEPRLRQAMVLELLDSLTSQLLDFLSLSFVFIDILGSFVKICSADLQVGTFPASLC